MSISNIDQKVNQKVFEENYEKIFGNKEDREESGVKTGIRKKSAFKDSFDPPKYASESVITKDGGVITRVPIIGDRKKDRDGK